MCHFVNKYIIYSQNQSPVIFKCSLFHIAGFRIKATRQSQQLEREANTVLFYLILLHRSIYVGNANKIFWYTADHNTVT